MTWNTNRHTEIICDYVIIDRCAVSIANDECKLKRLKAIYIRFHLVRDRVRANHFKITWKPGVANLADFFTKPVSIWL
jgi:hypothetical protein